MRRMLWCGVSMVMFCATPRILDRSPCSWLEERVHPITRGSPTCRAVVDRQTVHVHDLPAAVAEFPLAKDRGIASGLRTVLATPLLRDGHSHRRLFTFAVREVRPSPTIKSNCLRLSPTRRLSRLKTRGLIHDRETRNRDLAALHDVTAAASRSLEIKPVLDEVVRKITDIFNFDQGTIYLFDPQREYLNAAASFGTPEEAPPPRAFRRGQGLTGRVAVDR